MNVSKERMKWTGGVWIADSELDSGLNGVSPQVGDYITLHWSDGAEHTAKLEIAAVSLDSSPVKGG